MSRRGSDVQVKKGIAALVFLGCLLVSIVVLLVRLQFSRPYLMSGVITCLLLLVIFVITESSKTGPWHKNNEAENKFVSFVVFLGSTSLFFASDSPLYLGSTPYVGILLVLVCTYSVYHYDRVLTRRKMAARAKYLPRVNSVAMLDKELGKSKYNTIVTCLERLDFSFVAAKLLSSREIASAETTILSVLELTSRDELNYIVTNVNLSLLFYKVKDGDVLVPSKSNLTTRSKIMELLCVNRLSELDVSARVVLLDALQKMRLCAHPLSEQWVKHIFVQTTGERLIRLKSAFDTRGGSNLHSLIYSDISSRSIRNEILSHMRRQGELYLANFDSSTGNISYKSSNSTPLHAVRSFNSDIRSPSFHNQLEPLVNNSSVDPFAFDDYCVSSALPSFNFPNMSPTMTSSGLFNSSNLRLSTHPSFATTGCATHLIAAATRPLRKILSDVDDTLFSSGGKFPAGLDKSFPAHCIYPGVLEFYKELDIGCLSRNSESGIWPQNELGNLVFLSARPHVYKDKSEKRTMEVFEKIRRDNGMYQVPTLLSGSLDAGMKMFTGDYQPMAETKFKKFDEYAQMYVPEHSFVFVGDNGQGDVIAATLMREKYSDKLEATFIHRIQSIEKTPIRSGLVVDGDLLKSLSEKKIFFFKTYIEAALIAYQNGIIHVNGMRRIAMSARKDYLRLFNSTEESVKMSIDDLELRMIELNNDIFEMNNFIESNVNVAKKKLEVIPLLPYICRYSVGTLINFPPFKFLTPFTISNFREVDGIYELSSGINFKIYTKSYQNFSIFTKGSTGSRVITAFGTGVLTKIRPTGIHEIEIVLEHNNIFMFSLASSFDFVVAARGDSVITPMGPGIVVNFRKSDRMYQVHLVNTTSNVLVSSKVSSKNKITPLKIKLVKAKSPPRVWGTMFVCEDQVRLIDAEIKPSSRCIVM